VNAREGRNDNDRDCVSGHGTDAAVAKLAIPDDLGGLLRGVSRPQRG
jgi:hypothetical protein